MQYFREGCGVSAAIAQAKYELVLWFLKISMKWSRKTLSSEALVGSNLPRIVESQLNQMVAWLIPKRVVASNTRRLLLPCWRYTDRVFYCIFTKRPAAMKPEGNPKRNNLAACKVWTRAIVVSQTLICLVLSWCVYIEGTGTSHFDETGLSQCACKENWRYLATSSILLACIDCPQSIIMHHWSLLSQQKWVGFVCSETRRCRCFGQPAGSPMYRPWQLEITHQNVLIDYVLEDGKWTLSNSNFAGRSFQSSVELSWSFGKLGWSFELWEVSEWPRLWSPQRLVAGWKQLSEPFRCTTLN